MHGNETSQCLPRNLALLLYDNRSGSTLLSALLDSVSGISVSCETDVLPAVLEAAHGRQRVKRRRLEAVLVDSGRLEDLGIGSEWLNTLAQSNGQLRTRTVVQALLDEYFRRGLGSQPGDLWVVKGPRHHYYLHRLIEWFPEMLLVHIVRDGRAVFASKARSRSKAGRAMDRNPLRASHKWVAKLELLDRVRDRVCEIRYEDLVAEPASVVDGLLKCLGVDESFKYSVGEQRRFLRRIAPDERVELHSNLAKPPDPDHVGRWREQLDPLDVLLYERVAAGRLEQLGYEITVDPDAVRRQVGLRRMRWWLSYCADVVTSPIRWLRQGRTVRDELWRKINELRVR